MSFSIRSSSKKESKNKVFEKDSQDDYLESILNTKKTSSLPEDLESILNTKKTSSFSEDLESILNTKKTSSFSEELESILNTPLKKEDKMKSTLSNDFEKYIDSLKLNL